MSAWISKVGNVAVVIALVVELSELQFEKKMRL